MRDKSNSWEIFFTGSYQKGFTLPWLSKQHSETGGEHLK